MKWCRPGISWIMLSLILVNNCHWWKKRFGKYKGSWQNSKRGLVPHNRSMKKSTTAWLKKSASVSSDWTIFVKNVSTTKKSVSRTLSNLMRRNRNFLARRHRKKNCFAHWKSNTRMWQINTVHYMLHLMTSGVSSDWPKRKNFNAIVTVYRQNVTKAWRCVTYVRNLWKMHTENGWQHRTSVLLFYKGIITWQISGCQSYNTGIRWQRRHTTTRWIFKISSLRNIN